MSSLLQAGRTPALPRIAWDTPQRNRHAGASEWFRARGPLFDSDGNRVFQSEVNEYFGMPHAIAYRNIVRNEHGQDRRHHNAPEVVAERERSPSPCEAAVKHGDHRGRKILLSPEDIDRIDT